MKRKASKLTNGESVWFIGIDYDHERISLTTTQGELPDLPTAIGILISNKRVRKLIKQYQDQGAKRYPTKMFIDMNDTEYDDVNVITVDEGIYKNVIVDIKALVSYHRLLTIDIKKNSTDPLILSDTEVSDFEIGIEEFVSFVYAFAKWAAEKSPSSMKEEYLYEFVTYVSRKSKDYLRRQHIMYAKSDEDEISTEPSDIIYPII